MSDTSEVTCDECSGSLRPPLMICIQNHVVCPSCGYHCADNTASHDGGEPEDGCHGTETECTFFNKVFGKMMVYCQHKCGIRTELNRLRAHEDHCSKRPEPALCYVTHCTWQGLMSDVIDHVHCYHPELLVELCLHQDGEISIDLTNNVKLVTLFPRSYYTNRMYWLRLCEDGYNRYIILQYFGSVGAMLENSQNIEKFYVTTAANRHIKIHGNAVKVDSVKILDQSFVKEHGVEVFPYTSRKYIVKISETRHNATLPSDVLNCIECCHQEVMRLPIKLCVAGHSVCSNCRATYNYCPNMACHREITDQRNFMLENLMEVANVRCSYKKNGCWEVMPMSTREKHRNRCLYRPTECIITSECKWSGIYIDLHRHIEENHRVPTPCDGVETMSFVSTSTTHRVEFFSGFDNYFVFNQLFNEDGDFIFSLDHITRMDQSEFSFHVTLINPLTRYIISMSFPCNPISHTKDLEEFNYANDVCRIPSELFNNKLCFNSMFHYIVKVFKNIDV